MSELSVKPESLAIPIPDDKRPISFYASARPDNNTFNLGADNYLTRSL